MPPKRPRSRAVAAASESASASASPPPPTQRRRGPAAIRAPPSRSTRFARAVRGPDLAAKEGGAVDLVPPSSDEEYDEWRAVRAVERAFGTTAELHAESSAQALASAVPHAFVPLFDDARSDDEVDDEVDNQPTPSRKGKEREVARSASPPMRSPLPVSSPPPRSPLPSSSPLRLLPFRPTARPTVALSSGVRSSAPGPGSRRARNSISPTPSKDAAGLPPSSPPRPPPLEPLRPLHAQPPPLPRTSPPPQASQASRHSAHNTPTQVRPERPTTPQSSQRRPHSSPPPELQEESQLPESPGLEVAFGFEPMSPDAPIDVEPMSPNAPMDVDGVDEVDPVEVEGQGVDFAPPQVVAPEPPLDPALLKFRSTRTFRTRTALQLQPYTRERAMYESVIRRGGTVRTKQRVGHTDLAAIAVPREEEEDDSSSGSEAEEETPPDAIVIGNTQNSPRARPIRKPKELVDADFDEYFLRFGHVADEEDEQAARRLQTIARERLRVERRAKKLERDAERARRQFEAHIAGRNAEQQKAEARKAKEEREKRRAEERARKEERDRRRAEERSKAPSKDKTAAVRTPRPNLNGQAKTPRTTTYSRRRPQPAKPPVMLSDSELSDPPPLSEEETPRPPPLVERPLNRPSSTSSPPMRSPSPGPALDDYYEVPAFDDYDEPAFNAFAPDIFEESVEPLSPPTAPRQKARRRLSSSSSQSSQSDASMPEQPVQDKRKKIARRMLPAAMLKRLEREAADRAARKSAEQRRAARISTESPVRPGQAIVRRGIRVGGLEGMDDIFADDDSDDAVREGHEVEAEEGNTSASDGPIMVLDSSDSERSEAMEDNRRQDGLARLRQGDFEGLVRGRSAPGAARERANGQPAARQKPRHHVRRPAIGFRQRESRRDGSPEPRHLVQGRLDFPAVDKEQAREQARRSAAKGKKSATRAPRQRQLGVMSSRPELRPAIHLDDRVIFATEEFAFESETASVAPAPRKRQLATVTMRKDRPIHSPRSAASPSNRSVPSPGARRPAAAQVDDGVGKARSWANFDRFPVDFDITPLPSGVHLGRKSIPGSGQLVEFLGALESGGGADAEEPKPSHSYGIDLSSTMGPQELLVVLPVLVDGMHTAIVEFADGISARKPDLTPFEFVRFCLLRADETARSAAHSHFQIMGERLDNINLSGDKASRPALEQVALARYRLLELALLVDHASVLPAATNLIQLLLIYGFDRTMRPIRRLLRGDANTPEIADWSVALWVSAAHVLVAHDRKSGAEGTFVDALSDALEQRFRNEAGPLAAERIWFLVCGLCALSQFGANGIIGAEYTAYPRWALVKRAIGLIKITHSQEAEEAAHRNQLQGRDRYIKTMVARCLRLSSAWRWSFDRTSFSVATRDLGAVFKERGQRNLPTEPPADFPDFISRFDINLTVEDENTRHASAFELYLRLACVAASDIIGSAEALAEAQQAERDVQRLIMSIFPLSAVPFTRASPPTLRQLGALTNRYSTMVVACYFSPSLLPWLLANSLKWLSFDAADFDSRQVCIRGLMYLAVACRHHNHSLDTVVARFADILGTLQAELEAVGRPTNPAFFPTRVEIERTMVLVVTCFRQIIEHAGYVQRPEPVYPDPVLLHESWTARIFNLDLAKDVKSGVEIVLTIQAFLDARNSALPNRARRAREAKAVESLDDYPSLGFDFDAVDLAALGGDEVAEVDPIDRKDAEFAQIILNVICPRIYRLLSDMLPAVMDEAPADAQDERHVERQVFINKLTKCWSDLAGIVVVEHQLTDWSSYVGAFGQQSWSRLGNEQGRLQVGLHFMLNVARLDPGAFRTLEEEFISLLFQTIATDRLTVEHKYASAVFSLPGAADNDLFEGVAAAVPEAHDFTRATFMEKRVEVLRVIFANVPHLLRNRHTPQATKTLVYRCINLLVSSLVAYEARIDARRVLHRQSYRVFASEVVAELRRLAGEFVTPATVPGLKQVAWGRGTGVPV
ncbi:hypothetical protein Q8F55_000887 [Vanrija albida]|uniref:Uncharacterized protein n=1 Tax=Vanrija albida TaxID=181172 RepID=A0ABR3QEJ3_9TREE